MSPAASSDVESPTRVRLWLFDLDGCLVDSTSGTILRPHARELLEQIIARGAVVHIWSAGGDDYAQRVAERVGIADLVVEFHTKVRGDSGTWHLPAPAMSADLVCVDDQPEGVPSHVRTISVFPFIGARPHDRTLARLIETLDGHAAPSSHRAAQQHG